METLRIAFMGTPDFAVPALKALCESEHEVVCVYTQPPRPKGRGHKVQPSPIHAFAEEQGIPVHHPKSLKSAEEQAAFAAHNLDVAIVAAYGLILPKAILDVPKFGCINIHASLLPRWRGASPIQHAIWKGDAESGVTLMQMDEGLDTGPQIAKRAISITNETTTPILHDALAQIGGEMVLEALANIKTLTSTPQNNENSTYAPLLTKEDGRINWNQTAEQINRQIRALNPWPGTLTGEGETRLKILNSCHPEMLALKDLESSAQAFQDDKVGTLLDKQGHVVCGEQTILKLQRLQPPGKKAMDFAAALNGGYVKIGESLV